MPFSFDARPRDENGALIIAKDEKPYKVVGPGGREVSCIGWNAAVDASHRMIESLGGISSIKAVKAVSIVEGE